jgi:hypothetical protein
MWGCCSFFYTAVNNKQDLMRLSEWNLYESPKSNNVTGVSNQITQSGFTRAGVVENRQLPNIGNCIRSQILVSLLRQKKNRRFPYFNSLYLASCSRVNIQEYYNEYALLGGNYFSHAFWMVLQEAVNTDLIRTDFFLHLSYLWHCPIDTKK